MGKYLLKRGLLLNGDTAEIAEAGTVVELDDSERTQKLLERGTIVEAGEGVEVTPRLSAFEQAQKETAERNAPLLKEQQEQAAREAEVRAKLDADRNEEASESTVPLSEELQVSDSPESTPQTIQPLQEAPVAPDPQTIVQPLPQVPHQPTIAEIEATLAASEGGSTSSDEVQIS